MDKLTVTQADMDAAFGWTATTGRHGGVYLDDGQLCGLATAFASHRLAQSDALREALEGVLPYVLTDYFQCNGDKCRHPTCASCFGEDFAEGQSDKANLALTKAKTAIAALQEQSK